MPDRPNVRDAIGELGLLRGRSAPAPPRPAPSRDADDGRLLVRTDVQLPADLVARLRDLGRPANTGAPRTLSVSLLLQAFIRAVDELGLDIDLRGLSRDESDEAVRRVTTALQQWRGGQAD